jgi:hypothetical protein
MYTCGNTLRVILWSDTVFALLRLVLVPFDSWKRNIQTPSILAPALGRIPPMAQTVIAD